MAEKRHPSEFECPMTRARALSDPEAANEILRLRVELDHACQWLNELRRDLAKIEGRR